MADPYCGIGDVPKGYKRGTMRECAEKKQIRYYGIKKIDSKTLDLTKNNKVLPETWEKLMKERATLVGLVNRTKGRYETTKDLKTKDEYYDEWKKHETKLKKIVSKLKKLSIERDKLKKKGKLNRSKSKKSKSKKSKKFKSKSKKKSKSNKTKLNRSKSKKTKLAK